MAEKYRWPGGRDFLQAYNCQVVVDSAHQVIAAAPATNLTSDERRAVAMVEETVSNTGSVPRKVSADVGYYSARAVDDLQALGVDSFIALDQTRHGRVLPPAPKRPALAQVLKRPISTPNFSAGLVVDPRANF